MKGFLIDDNGDVVIDDRVITMTDGNTLLLQKIRQILGTNKGEWAIDTNEGINFSNILGKNKTDDVIKSEILSGLRQIDDTFYITEWKSELNKKTRSLTVDFTAKNSDGVSVSDTYSVS